MIEQNGIEIDEDKAKTLLYWLIHNESQNVKTISKTDVQFQSDIEKKIKEVVECY